MQKLLITLLLLLVSTGAAAQKCQHLCGPNLPHVDMGTYIGSLYHGIEDRMVPAKITIWQEPIGGGRRRQGEYFFVEADERVIEGFIFDCNWLSDNLLKCQWKDLYGKGLVDFEFSPDRSSFNGRWYKEYRAVGGPWNGKKGN